MPGRAGRGGGGDAVVVMRRGVGADAAKGTPGGTVVLFASTADMAWKTWGRKPSVSRSCTTDVLWHGPGRR